MKVNAINLRPGSAIEIDGKLLIVTKNDINQPGKGAAVAQVEARDARTGLKSNFRFRTQEQVETAELFDADYQYLYEMEGIYYFMNQENFEQLEVPGDVIGDPKDFLQANMTVTISTHEGRPISTSLPQKVTMEVTEADPVVKGQTQSSSYKPAKLENGRPTLVPPHIEAGTRIVVMTADGSYVERAKD
ncbi:elongation factor P [Marivibrio halodurans]|uniref:Elongation factor P n=1 Tax=Marivibrio halodurans TaxID=2039722 RepID=A0A8J7V394_9PROT|nr:elongation factor P [Marivibrio halodurans]MBP5857712.1 elongation factor P [Marivibrio halodurans]